MTSSAGGGALGGLVVDRPGRTPSGLLVAAAALAVAAIVAVVPAISRADTDRLSV